MTDEEVEAQNKSSMHGAATAAGEDRKKREGPCGLPFKCEIM